MERFDFKTAVTHSTIFHADDVFGVAMCRLIDPKIRVIRTLKPEEIPEEEGPMIVFDIGMGKYDHHQEDKALRPDGTPYCGFGLLWRDFGHILCPDMDAWQKVDQALVYLIDKAVLDCYLDSPTEEILILDEYLPWADAVQKNEKLRNVVFCVYPSQRGGWNVQTVNKEPGSYKNRMDFPTEWLGHADPSRGIHFAHTANFLIACDTKEQAVKVAEEAVEAGKQEYTCAYSI